MAKRKGFTLIELLVVIAIIALLMAILMPALAKVRRQARVMTCQMSLKQWGTTFGLYCSDNEGFFGYNANRPTCRWYNWLQPYYAPTQRRDVLPKDNKALLCPMASQKFWSDETTGSIPGPTQTAYMAWGKFPIKPDVADTPGVGGSYGSNTWASVPEEFEYDSDKEKAKRCWKTIQTPNGSVIPLIGDCAHIGGKPYTDSLPSLAPPTFDGHWCDLGLPTSGTAYSIARFVMNRHGRGMNMAFLDGTVRKLGLKEPWSLKWEPYWELCNPYTKCYYPNRVVPSDMWPEWMRDEPDY